MNVTVKLFNRILYILLLLNTFKNIYHLSLYVKRKFIVLPHFLLLVAAKYIL